MMCVRPFVYEYAGPVHSHAIVFVDENIPSKRRKDKGGGRMLNQATG